MNLFCEGNLEAQRVEVEISNSYDGWMYLSKILCNATGTTEIPSKMDKDKVYPRNLKSMIVKESSIQKKLKVYIDISKEKLIFEGSKECLSAIGNSIYSYFSDDVYDGLHFHLDYFPPEIDSFCLLAPTNCSLIFVYHEEKL